MLKITPTDDGLHFYGHGKLLITGEYFVLDGAQALAVPTKFGQLMRIKNLAPEESILYWVALNSAGKPWLNLVFDTADFKCLNAQSDEANRLTRILTEARKLNPAFLSDKKDCAVETRLEFPNEWGLGTSSTLIYALSRWAQVDGYTLLKNTIGGSGYDVACAAHNTPIIYSLQQGVPETIAANWKPAYSGQLYFAYTGKKQLSSEGIKHYQQQQEGKAQAVSRLSHITSLMLNCNTLQHFEELINEHENIVAAHLKMVKAKDGLFSDYWGAVKSLGAWGGDFAMLTNTQSESELKDYLATKEIDTVFSWEELILSPA